MKQKRTLFDYALWTALPMAQTSQIEGRLTTILDKNQSRRTLTRRVLLTAFGLASAALIPLAMLRPAAKAQTGVKTVDVQTVGDISVRLEGAAESDSAGSRWWARNGSLLTPKSRRWSLRGHGVSISSPNTKNVAFSFHLLPSPEAAEVAFDAVGSAGTAVAQNKDRKGVWILTAGFPPAMKTATLRVGVAAGTWTTAASNFSPSLSIGTGHDGNTFLFTAATKTPQGGSTVTIANNDVNQDYRFLAIDTQNVAHFSSGSTITSGTITQRTLHFNLPLSKIKEIRVETRPYQWVEFKNVALQPIKS